MDIAEAVGWYPINISMSNQEVLTHLLDNLYSVLSQGVPGDVVELGCHAGDTSVFLARMIHELDPTRTLHLYDSFQGLPPNHPKDNPDYGGKGTVRTQEVIVRRRFLEERLRMPQIHAGWFSEIAEEDFPEKVAFAFFDGDLYQSIWDSFTRVYNRMSPGGIICVHDYDVSNWPGTKAACDDFLANKPERMENPCFLLGTLRKA